jgi:hypothetical protein
MGVVDLTLRPNYPGDRKKILLNMRTARTRIGVDTLEEINIFALSEIKHPFSTVNSKHNHTPH